MSCKHDHVITGVNFNRITESDDNDKIKCFTADISIRCEDCGVPFVFTGCEVGVNFSYPTVSFNGEELRCPLKPSENFKGMT